MAGARLKHAWRLLLLLAPAAAAGGPPFPVVGEQVPVYVSQARTASRDCLTKTNHRDPCAEVKIQGIVFTIAWDAGTKAVTYLFTHDEHLVTDSELGVGGSCRMVDPSGGHYPMTHYLDWVVTEEWSDAVRSLSGGARWHAVFPKEAAGAEYGSIAGFVQSRYLPGTAK